MTVWTGALALLAVGMVLVACFPTTTAALLLPHDQQPSQGVAPALPAPVDLPSQPLPVQIHIPSAPPVFDPPVPTTDPPHAPPAQPLPPAPIRQQAATVPPAPPSDPPASPEPEVPGETCLLLCGIAI
jgi:hypothetical protein